MYQFILFVLSVCLIPFTSTSHEVCNVEALKECGDSLERLFASQFAKIYKTEQELAKFCDDLKSEVYCLRNSTEACQDDVPGVVLAEEVTSGYIYSICLTNSTKKKLFMSQSQCLSSIQNQLQECSPILSTEGKTEEEIEEDICREHSNVVECLVRKGEQFCENDGKKVITMMLNPWNHFMAMQCDANVSSMMFPDFFSGNMMCDDGDVEECIHYSGSEMIAPAYMNIQPTAHDLDHLCQKIKRKSTCFSMKTGGCSEQLIKDLGYTADLVNHFMNSFCVAGALRQKYLTKAECLISARVEYFSCHNKTASDAESKDLGAYLCKKHAAIFDCVSAKSKNVCDEEGKEVMDEVMSVWRQILARGCANSCATWSQGTLFQIAVVTFVLLLTSKK